MSEDDTVVSPAPAGDGERSFRTWLGDMPRWKKIAVGTAIATIVVSGVWSLAAGVEPTPAGDGTSGLRASFVEGQPATGDPTPIEEPASKGVFRLGFSFLAGFCLGSFLRATLKIAAIAFGFWLLMTFVLSYNGIVVVDWNAMDALWRRFADSVSAEWGSFQSFVTGSLPAAGLATGGLVVGLKRH